MTDNTAKTLVQKLALASALVGGKLKADKKNMQDNYEYVSANKILSECGQALADNGISIIPSIKARDVQVFDRGNGKYRYDATVDMAFKITDGVTSFEETWFGMGSDYTVPDKAMYKAITSGHKYFISKLFCIGEGNEGNEDSEHDTPEDAKPAPKPAQAQRPAQPPAQHAPIVPIPSAPVVTDEWPADFIQEMVIAYKASHANQIKNALKGASLTPADGVDLGREWMRVYKANRESGMTTTEATAAANETIDTMK